MPVGTVKWFNTTKGYGFIAPDEGGTDVFVHISAVEASGMTGLADNQKVSYELTEGRDGRKWQRPYGALTCRLRRYGAGRHARPALPHASITAFDASRAIIAAIGATIRGAVVIGLARIRRSATNHPAHRDRLKPVWAMICRGRKWMHKHPLRLVHWANIRRVVTPRLCGDRRGHQRQNSRYFENRPHRTPSHIRK